MSISRHRHQQARRLPGVAARVIGAVAVAAAAGLIGADSALAAGSAQFNTQQRLSDATTVYADILEAGETINISMSTATTVTIFDTRGTRDVADDGPVLDVGLADNLSPTDPMTGPLADAYRYTPTSPGTYRIELDTGSNPNNIDRFDITVTDTAAVDPDPTRPTGRGVLL